MDSPVWGDPWIFQLFSWCILKANFQEGNFRGEVLTRGQFVTGKHIASEELGVTTSKWFRGMAKLVEMGCITTEAKPRFTIVSVCNYETYQSCEVPKRNPDETEMKPKRNRDETQVEPIEEGLEGKDKKRAEPTTARIRPEDVQIPAELDTTEFRVAVTEWFAQRRSARLSLKPEYVEKSYQRLLPLGAESAAACLMNTVDNGYQGIFPEKFSKKIGHSKSLPEPAYPMIQPIRPLRTEGETA